MKKTILHFLQTKALAVIVLLLYFGSSTFNASAQISSSTYSFSQTSYGTFSTIVGATGDTTLSNSSSDDEYYLDRSSASALTSGVSTSSPTGTGFDIGFNFELDGNVYDRFGVCNNGWISLGQSALSPAVDMRNASGYSSFWWTFMNVGWNSSVPAALKNRICVLAKDLVGQSGSSIQFLSYGTAPYRSLTIEFVNYNTFGGTASDSYNFQITLNETTNSIVLSYGTFTVTGTAYPYMAQVGIQDGVSATSWMIRGNNGSSGWSSTSAGASTADWLYLYPISGGYYYPSTGLVYTFAEIPKTYTSGVVNQITNAGVALSSTNQHMLKLDVDVVGNGGYLPLTSLDVTTNGMVALSDISNIKVYTSGLSPSFASATQFGTTNSSPGSTNTFTDSINLSMGHNYFWVAYSVASGATLGDTLFAQIPSITVAGSPYTPTVGTSGYRVIETPETYVSSTTALTDASKVAQNSANNNILQLKVVASSSGSTIDVTSLDIATTGTTSLSDIANLKVWYTGTSSTFDTVNQFGTTVAAPSATQTVTGTQSIANNTNYFWVTYDVMGGATVGNVIDAQLTSVTVDGVAQTPTVTSPSGSREIRAPYCTPSSTYTGASYYYMCINSVWTTGASTNLSNMGTGWTNSSSTGYTNYLSQTLVVSQNTAFTLHVCDYGWGYMGWAAWIDYNGDGVFSASERVYYNNTSYNTYTSCNQGNVTVPCTANTGMTRMRIRVDYFNAPSSPCSTQNYGETEDYSVNIVSNPPSYVSSIAKQFTGIVAPGASDATILRIPVQAGGCGVGTITDMYFNTNGSTNASGDIASAKLYATGNSALFSTSNLLGTVATPNGAFSFTGFSDTLLVNPGDTNNFWLAYNITSGATPTNVVDAQIDSLNAIGTYHVPTNNAPTGTREIVSPMTYVSTTSLQNNLTKVGAGSSSNNIIELQVVTSSTGAPITVSSIDVATTGTTSLSDILNLKVWYTGNGKNFDTTTQFGSTVAIPSATQTVTGTQPLTNDTNYFWVSYDISAAATLTDVVDAQLTSVTVDGVAETPTVTSPTGSREIRQAYCIPQYSTSYYYMCINTVQTSGAIVNLNNTGTGLTTNPYYYIYYSGLTLEAKQNTPFSLHICDYGWGYNGLRAWIDYNQDGIFTASEIVFDFPGYNTYTSCATQTVTIPCTATPGLTRMRVRADYFAMPDPCSNYSYGETEDYNVNVIYNPPSYVSSTTSQNTGIVSPSTNNAVILNMHVIAAGCGLATLSEMYFNTNGSTSPSGDIASAKLYATGNSATFSTNKLLGTVATPAGSFAFTGFADTLLQGATDINNFWLTYDITSGATTSNLVDAEIDSLYAVGGYHIPSVTAPTGSREIVTPMTFTSTTTAQTDLTKVATGSSKNNILQLQVVTSSTGAPISVTSMDIATTGTTSLSDILNMNVYYTGNSKNFDTTTQFGSTVVSPSATQTVSGTQPLTNDTNYFWVTYDIASSATLTNVVDAQLTSVMVDGTGQTPTVTSPIGTREIRQPYCRPTATYSYYYMCVNSVWTVGATTNFTNMGTGMTTNTGNYVYYPTKTVAAKQNSTFTLHVCDYGWGYMGWAAWIDYNGDGVFAAAERIYYNNTAYNTYTSCLQTDVTIPCTATVGLTRMRIRVDYFNAPSSPCSTQNYGETEDYNVDVLSNPVSYTSSVAHQITGVVAPATTDAQIMRIPVLAGGCGVGTVTEMYFNTNGSSNPSTDISSAKLYVTGTSATFTNSNLLGTVATPSGSFAFTGFSDSLKTNPGDTNNFWLVYDIASGATTTDFVDAEIDSMYAVGGYHIPSVTAPAGNREIVTPMSYVSTTTAQTDLTKVAQGSSNNNILQLQVVTSSTGAPINLTSMDIATTGSTSVSDITNLKVWYTANSKIFAATSQFGSTVISPSATQTVTGVTSLTNDTNYFWVTYDIASGATLTNVVDAQLTSITVDGTTQTPTVTSPTGTREIRQAYCTPSATYSYYYMCINSVYTSGGSTNINNLGTGMTTNTGNYVDYTATQKLTIGQNGTFTLNLCDYGWGYMGIAVWIDYNGDGAFAAAEKVYTYACYTSYISCTSTNLTVPCSASTGLTRMRVRCDYFNIPTSPCATQNYGETEDYAIDIVSNPISYVSSAAHQISGLVNPGATDAAVLRLPVLATGCGIGTITDMYFNTNGSSNAAGDISSAKLYATGNSATFNTSKLLATVSSPSGSFSFTGFSDTLLSNASDTNNYWLAYDIASGATLTNVVDAEVDSITAVGTSHIPSVTAPSGNIEINSPVSYVSSVVTQAVTTKVGKGSTKNEVIGLEVVTTTSGSPINLTTMDIATTGTTSLSDITNLRVWYTGASSTFATTTQFGTTVASPAATQTVSGTTTLNNGTSYFWVTYDIASGATLGNVVDAEISSITVDGVPQTPSTTAPTGSRAIRNSYCTPSYSTGTGASDVITNVSFGGFSNTTSGSGSPYYTYYSSLTATVTAGAASTYSMTVLPAGGDEYVGLWIDFNDDGTFQTSERLINNVQTSGYSLSQSIVIPISASAGTYRMRVRISYNTTSGNFDPCNSYTYGETEDYNVEIVNPPAPTTYVWNQTGSASYQVASNWTPSRTTVLQNDILEFNGGGTIDVTNVPSQVINQLIVDAGTNVWLHAPSASTVLAVYGTLSLTSGLIVTDNNSTLSLGLTPTMLGTLSGSGTIDGKFQRWIDASASSYSFPMVVGSDNRSVTVNYTTAPSAAGTLTYQFVHGVPTTSGLPLTDGSITDNAVDTSGLFVLTSGNGLTGGSYTGTFEADNFVGIQDYTQLSLIQRNSSAASWTLNGTLITTTGSNTAPILSRSGMNAYGQFGVSGNTSQNTLPVNMLSFSARNVNGDVLLNWSTSSEQNNKGFDVERSLDGKTFNFVKFVNGAGNSTVVENYATIDNKAFDINNSNILYYRLKQIDLNGKYVYSNIVNVLKSSMINGNSISVYPNPSAGRFNIEVEAAKDVLANIVITDSKGQELSNTNVQLFKGSNTNTINLESASNGVYFVKVIMNGETKVTRITKVN